MAFQHRFLTLHTFLTRRTKLLFLRTLAAWHGAANEAALLADKTFFLMVRKVRKVRKVRGHTTALQPTAYGAGSRTHTRDCQTRLPFHARGRERGALASGAKGREFESPRSDNKSWLFFGITRTPVGGNVGELEGVRSSTSRQPTASHCRGQEFDPPRLHQWTGRVTHTPLPLRLFPSQKA
jgi:hypothetical protein